MPKLIAYELAKGFNITNKNLSDILDSLDEPALNHMCVLNHDEASIGKRLYPYQQSYKVRF